MDPVVPESVTSVDFLTERMDSQNKHTVQKYQKYLGI